MTDTTVSPTPLTDSYVSATLRSVPRAQRADIERELRASIADDIDGRVENGATPSDAEYAALEQLGDPARLAANYAGRTLTLIGPNTYTSYVTTLKVVASIAVPIVFVVLLIIALVKHATLWPAILGALGPALTVAAYLAVFLTIAFALVDRAATRGSNAAHRGTAWSPKSLPAENRPQPKTGLETVWSVVFTVILVAAVEMRRTDSPVSNNGVPTQVLDPSLWKFWLPYFLVVLLLGLALDFVRLGMGRWHPIPTSIGTLLTLAGAIPLVVLVWNSKIVNPALLRAINLSQFSQPGGWLSILIAIFVALVAIGNITDEWSKRKRGWGKPKSTEQVAD
jgi:hypothetical protein